ncbi:MAG: hypothetical protein HYS18_06985, partial [Burkholderiales bacterium]|nr:hypothetical protein [Burkholderiales bacterium]
MALDAQGNPTGLFASLQGKITIVIGAGSVSEAKTDFFTFLSLYNLVPFIIRGDSSVETALANAWNTVYINWLAEKNLTEEQRSQGDGNFSDQWLKDRTKMLGWMIKRNRTDTPSGQAFLTKETTDSWKFIDDASNTTITINPDNVLLQPPQHIIRFGKDDANDNIDGGETRDNLYGNGGDDIIDGKGGDDYLEGNAGNDNLIGGDGKDYLLGGTGNDNMAGDTGNDTLLGGLGNDTLAGGDDDDRLIGGDGDDTLNGGNGADILYGGSGSDTYNFSSGDGTDTIIDHTGDGKGGDGLGKVFFDGTSMTRTWTVKDAFNKTYGDGTWTLKFAEEPGQLSTLVITRTGSKDRIVIQGFKNGDLGITLGDMPEQNYSTVVDTSGYNKIG